MDEQSAPELPERLAYWYLRLNGFLTIEDFAVHHETRPDPRTDADLLAVRFKHRSENRDRPMIDDGIVSKCRTFANVIIGEATKGQCKLNGPWTDPRKENMQRVLSSIGCVSPVNWDFAAKALYESGKWNDQNVTVRIFAIGEWKDPNLPVAVEQQLVWSSIIDFCMRRFQEYERQKRAVRQWAPDGLALRSLCVAGDQAGIRAYFGLRDQLLD